MTGSAEPSRIRGSGPILLLKRLPEALAPQGDPCTVERITSSHFGTNPSQLKVFAKARPAGAYH
jgi:hypothetical protein